MRGAGFSSRFSLGTVMSGGTLGIITPPSIPLILYGLVTETSIVDLFRAGVGPGLLLVALFAAYAVIRNWNMPTQRFSLTVHREIGFRHLKGVVPDPAKLGGALFPLIAVALNLTMILIENRVPDMMIDLVEGRIDNAMTAFKARFIERVKAAVRFIRLIPVALGLISWLPSISLYCVR